MKRTIKTFAVMGILALSIFSFSANAATYIGENRAKEIALEHAGLKANQVTFVETYLEMDDGRWEYEVEFYTGDYKEYDYEIDASTGTIIGYDYDAEHDNHLTSPGTKTTNYIGEAKVKEIALKHAGVSADAICQYTCTLDDDDGVAQYDVEFKAANYEYELDIDATSGRVLDYEKEID